MENPSARIDLRRDNGKGMMIRYATALLGAFLLCLPAAAKEAKVGDVSLNLPTPHGHCEMDPVVAADARLISSLHKTLAKTGNRLLGLSADCAELKDWRSGKRLVLDHMAGANLVAVDLHGADLGPRILSGVGKGEVRR